MGDKDTARQPRLVQSALSFCVGPAALAGYVPAPMPAPPSPVAAWMTLARRAVGAGDAPDALRCFEGALAHEPGLALAHLGRAVCLARMARADEARDALEATLAAAGGQEDVLYHLARMCAGQGQTAFAMPLLVEAVAAQPALRDVAARDPMFRDHPAYLAAMGKL